MKKVLLLVFAFTGLAFIAPAQWVQTSCPKTEGIDALTPQGTLLFAGSTGVGAFVSADYGHNWSPVSNGLPFDYITSIVTCGGNLFAGTFTGVYRSVDNGNNWSPADTGLTSPSIFTLEANNSEIFASVFMQGAFLTTNNGSSWSFRGNGLPIVTTMDENVSCFAFIGTDVFAGTLASGVFISLDNGAHWALSSNGIDVSEAVSAFAGSGPRILLGTANGLYYSTDGGANWVLADSSLMHSDIERLLVHGTTVFAGTTNGIYASYDNGDNFTSIDDNLAAPNIWAIAVHGSYLFVGTDTSGVWRRPLSEVIGLDEAGETNEIKIYPNPTTGIINLQLPQDANHQNCTFDIYNMQGSLMMQKQITETNIQLDISPFANGIYLMHISNNEKTEVVKIIKQ